MPIRRSQKKRNAEPRQKQNHRRLVIDPMVNPGSSAHRHQARSKAEPTRPHHRMVTLAQSSPGDRSARAPQSKTATVMLGDPRVVPSFRCTFLPDMPPSPTTGSPYIVSSKFTMPTWSSPHPNRLDTPKTPAIRSTRALTFAASLVYNCYGLSACSPPLDGSDWDTTQPPEAFTSRLSTGRSPFPTLDMTTTSIGLLCRRDLHPLEWQLASLH